MRSPTERQLNYLDDLGYVGEDPDSLEIASMAIDMMKDGSTSKKTEKAVSKANKKLAAGSRSCLGSCLVTAIVIVLIVIGWVTFFSQFPPK